MKKIRKIKYLLYISIFSLLFIGCSSNVDSLPNIEATEIAVAGPDSYDSADQAVITEINKIEKTITFYNNVAEKTYTLTYDGASILTDKFGNALSSEQLRQGQIVNTTFLKSKKRLTTLQIIAEGISHENITKYTFDLTRGTMSVGTDTYNLAKDIYVFSDGEIIELSDINASDTISVYGTGTDIRSIIVEQGHGYLSLTNHQQFIGGYIEIGQVQICKVTEDMMILVPEGTYDVTISKNGEGGTLPVTILRNQEATLDMGVFTVAEPSYGTVVFNKSPSDLTIYINGEALAGVSEVTLAYGIYELMAIREGYETSFSYLKVGAASTTIDISLVVEVDTTTTTTDTTTDTTLTSYTVTINEPLDTDVYVNGSYVGTAPVSFTKEAGSHVITLSKDGYDTKSYTIQIDSEEKDVSYVFPELDG